MKWLRPLVSILLLGVLYNLVDFDEVIANLMSIPPRYIVVALLLFSLSIAVFTYKWKVCLPTARFQTLLRAYLASMFFFLLPTGTLGAEVSKLTVARTDGISLNAVAASIALDKLTGLAALALVGSVAGFLGTIEYSNIGAATLLISALAALVLVQAAGPLSALVASRSATAGMVRTRLSSLAASITESSDQPGLIGKTLVVGIFAQCIVVAIYASIATGLGIAYSLPDFVLCVVVANLVSVLPITLAGLGVRELGLVALLAQIGINEDASTALALAVFGIFLAGSVAGFINQLLPNRSPSSDT